jgi:hypothetical protein
MYGTHDVAKKKKKKRYGSFDRGETAGAAAYEFDPFGGDSGHSMSGIAHPTNLTPITGRSVPPFVSEL